jgi:hypothetical protein
MDRRGGWPSRVSIGRRRVVSCRRCIWSGGWVARMTRVFSRRCGRGRARRCVHGMAIVSEGMGWMALLYWRLRCGAHGCGWGFGQGRGRRRRLSGRASCAAVLVQHGIEVHVAGLIARLGGYRIDSIRCVVVSCRLGRYRCKRLAAAASTAGVLVEDQMRFLAITWTLCSNRMPRSHALFLLLSSTSNTIPHRFHVIDTASTRLSPVHK